MSRVKRSEKLDSLFSQDYRVIDFLPSHVAEHGNSIFEEVESYFLQDKQLQEFCDKAIAIILKVICYYPFEVYVEEYPPLKPKRSGWLKEKTLRSPGEDLKESDHEEKRSGRYPSGKGKFYHQHYRRSPQYCGIQ